MGGVGVGYDGSEQARGALTRRRAGAQAPALRIGSGSDGAG